MHFIKIRKISKGGTLGKKKIQSSPIWPKLAGLVGTIKKTSWEVILKCSCTLLRPERSKKKAATTDFSQLQPPWRHGRPCLATYLHGGMAAQARTSPSSNLQPGGLLSAVHTHNLAVYSSDGADSYRSIVVNRQFQQFRCRWYRWLSIDSR